MSKVRKWLEVAVSQEPRELRALGHDLGRHLLRRDYGYVSEFRQAIHSLGSRIGDGFHDGYFTALSDILKGYVAASARAQDEVTALSHLSGTPHWRLVAPLCAVDSGCTLQGIAGSTALPIGLIKSAIQRMVNVGALESDGDVGAPEVEGNVSYHLTSFGGRLLRRSQGMRRGLQHASSLIGSVRVAGHATESPERRPFELSWDQSKRGLRGNISTTKSPPNSNLAKFLSVISVKRDPREVVLLPAVQPMAKRTRTVAARTASSSGERASESRDTV